MEDYICFFYCYLLIICIFLVFWVKNMVYGLWLTPKKVENYFLKQGIKGPKYQLFWGNLKELSRLNSMASAEYSMPLSHHILPRVLTFYHHWKNIYGSLFVVWFGSTARLTISDPVLIKEIFHLKSECFEKIESPLQVKRIEGDGLLNLKGEKWAHHRKIIQPIFHTENLKLMIPMMAKTMEESLTKWTQKMSNTGKVEIEVEVSVWFQNLVGQVISRTTFGRNYEDGLAIFQLQEQQLSHATSAYQKVFIPGYRFLPTSQNRISRKLGKQIRESLLNIIDRRRKSIDWSKKEAPGECPTDLLELMIKSADESSRSNNSLAITENDIVEECKTIFFAGKHTTSNLLTWTTVLLAMHRPWQEQAREEVLRVCGERDTPTKDDLSKLKMLGMILSESLRLYPPVVAIIRRAKIEVHLTGVHIPRGGEVLIPILAVHHDPIQWGDDAQEFNPTRFAAGRSQAAKHPMAFIPFGSGARRCIGQNLAVLQTKLAITMILRRFSFELSPNYRHAPSVLMLLHPKYGAPIVFRKI